VIIGSRRLDAAEHIDVGGTIGVCGRHAVQQNIIVGSPWANVNDLADEGSSRWLALAVR